MAFQSGPGVVWAIRKQAARGTLGVNDAQACILPRSTIDLALSKGKIESKLMRTDRQRAAPRHGRRQVAGNWSTEGCPGIYSEYIGAVLRRDFAAVNSITGLSNVTASASAPHFVRAAGSWITDGLRVGMRVRFAGWTTTGTANNAKNYTIVALTATGMTVAETVAAKASGDSLTITVPGKVTYVPTTGHTKNYYTFERWAAAAGQSYRFRDVFLNSLDITCPPEDNVTLQFGAMGIDRLKAGAQLLTSAVALTHSRSLVGLSGALLIQGTAQLALESFSLKITNGAESKAVAFSNVSPDVFDDTVMVSGSLSVLEQDGVLDDYFDLEQPCTIIGSLYADSTGSGDFVSFALPNVVISGGKTADNKTTQVQSYDFDAGRGDGSNGWETTTLQIQDSAAP